MHANYHHALSAHLSNAFPAQAAGDSTNELGKCSVFLSSLAPWGQDTMLTVMLC